MPSDYQSGCKYGKEQCAVIGNRESSVCWSEAEDSRGSTRHRNEALKIPNERAWSHIYPHSGRKRAAGMYPGRAAARKLFKHSMPLLALPRQKQITRVGPDAERERTHIPRVLSAFQRLERCPCYAPDSVASMSASRLRGESARGKSERWASKLSRTRYGRCATVRAHGGAT